jgi:hypothetical protein
MIQRLWVTGNYGIRKFSISSINLDAEVINGKEIAR